ncbi:helix-turn-helix domain-containing protein [Paenibacillus xylanilyticus]|uniref:Helix-turn-helix domain-containing protein n=1 Tax=Paenibacillus xylanilyticus TaxID=248903 RepID=A0A7Y6EWH3_9BACL|nr:helix-turn-helix domain-containing protein [Paenibacillus xylanilyticus]NUU76778.1 helix-turn-helix domain-containing protein [Paenibacillus xylanilyticus]
MSKYKVMLVEDELPARTVFREMILQRQDLLELVGEASDGKGGLELYERHQPHLIVTDITMPGMNGLDMLRSIREGHQPQPLIVILTCHQDFHFAHQAIYLNADVYLIKDDCLTDPQLLARTLEELTRKAGTLDETRVKQQQLEQQVRSNEMEIEQNQFLEMLRHPVAEQKWLDGLEQAQLPVRTGTFKVLLVEIDRHSLRFSLEQLGEKKLWQFAGSNVMKELLNARGPNKVVALDRERFFSIYDDQTNREYPSFLDQLQQALTSNLKMSALILEVFFAQGIASHIETLKRLASAPYPFFYQQQQVATESVSRLVFHFQSIPEQMTRFWTKTIKSAFMETISRAAAADQVRHSFFMQAAELRWDPEQIKSLYLRIVLELGAFVIEARGGADIEAEFRKRLENCQTFHAVHDASLTSFLKLQALQGDESRLDASIYKIVQQINEDLSYPYKLEELAGSINYSVPYFSSMFKKNMGESFMQYLTRLRLEKAKLLLLTTDQKTFEISEAIGFENYRSFNRVFKKETGVSPSDFRQIRPN